MNMEDKKIEEIHGIFVRLRTADGVQVGKLYQLYWAKDAAHNWGYMIIDDTEEWVFIDLGERWESIGRVWDLTSVGRE